MRRIIIPYLGFFIAGICLYTLGIWTMAGAVLSALFFLLLFKNRTSFIILAVMFVLLGYVSTGINTYITNNTYTRLSKMERFEGDVYDKSGTAFTVVNRKENYRIKVYVYGDIDIVPGDYVSFKGQIREKRAYSIKIMNSLSLDAYASCQSSQMEKYQVHDITIVPVKIRYRLSTALEKVDASGGAFVSGIVTGQTSGISDKEKEAFSDTGLSHILAVSGFNLGIIFYAVLMIFSKLPKRLRYSICMIICLVYVFITGFQPSITRAFIMVFIASLGVFLKRDYDATTSVSVAALLMLVCNPYLIYNTGFQLSFAATYGILLLKDDIEERMPKWLELIKGEASIACAAFIATLPVIMYSKGYFSVISVLFNLLVAPFISILTIGSFVCSIIFLISGFDAILYPAVACGKILVRLVIAADSINLMVFPGTPSIWFILGYYILLMVCFGYIRIKRGSRGVKVGLVVMLLIFLLHKGNVLEIHVINVGQGDSIFIETPGGYTVLIDTGPAFSDYNAAQSRVIPYIRKQGYNSIDMLIITHFHSDHAGGLDYILNNFKVGSVVAFDAAEADNVDCTTIAAGDSISLGGVVMNVLYPQPGEEGGDENECCLVMELVYGEYNMLLTADAEREVMDTLSGEYEVLKLPHHGSGASFSYDMAEASQIGSAVVSVGKNSYGHPSNQVLSYLDERGVKVYRTDTQGNISIITSGKTYRIVSQTP